MRLRLFSLLIPSACESGAIALEDKGAAGTDSTPVDDTGTDGSDSVPADDTGTDSTGTDDTTDTTDTTDPGTTTTPCAAYGLVAEEALTLAEGTQVDGWSSALGGYGGANSQQPSMIAVNAAGSCAANIGGVVTGDVWIGAGADPATAACFGWGGSVSGAVQVLAAPVPIETPVAPGLPAGTAPLRASWGETLRLDADQSVTGFTVEYGSAVEVLRSITVLVEGDLAIDGATVTIAPGERLELFVTGAVRIGWGAWVNTDGEPAQLSIRMLGGDLVMDSGSYASADIRSGGGQFSNNGGQFYGSWSGARLGSAWGAGFHLDEASICP